MNAEFSTTSLLPILEQQLHRLHPQFAKVVRHFYRAILNNISQGFPLDYHVVHSLSHQFVYYNLGTLHHHADLKISPINLSFSLKQITVKFHHTEQITNLEHISNRSIMSNTVLPVSNISIHILQYVHNSK